MTEKEEIIEEIRKEFGSYGVDILMPYMEKYALLHHAELNKEKIERLKKILTEKAEGFTGSIVRKEESDIYGDGYVDGLDTAIDKINEVFEDV